jgi:hypothetical protein
MHLAWMVRMSEFSRDAEETYAIGGPSLARRISQSSGSVFSLASAPPRDPGRERRRADNLLCDVCVELAKCR